VTEVTINPYNEKVRAPTYRKPLALYSNLPSESASEQLSNEWSCQYVSTILNFDGNFCVPPLVTEVTISPYTGNEKVRAPTYRKPLALYSNLQ
jgi:hypothetical protein